MAKPKLDLYSKTDSELEQFSQTHQEKTTGNPAFPDPVPSILELAQSHADYAMAVDEKERLDLAAQAAAAVKNQKREKLMADLTQRGNYVSLASKGDPAIILSAGFDVSDTNRIPLEITAPVHLMVSLGDKTGLVDLVWDTVPGARAYVIECRLNDESLPWQQAAITTRSRASIPNLESGKTYAFRVKAIGAKGESAWCTAVVKLVA